MSSPQYLDLDALSSVTKTIKFKGKEHVLQPISVDDFIANVKTVQGLGTAPGFEEEVNAVIGMLKRAFPSFEEADMRSLPLEHLNRILAFAQANDGTEAVQDEAAKEAAANPQTAG